MNFHLDINTGVLENALPTVVQLRTILDEHAAGCVEDSQCRADFFKPSSPCSFNRSRSPEFVVYFARRSPITFD